MKKILIAAASLLFTISASAQLNYTVQTACHPKDEVAISVGDYELTSAVYSYYLVMADQAAKSVISSDKTSNFGILYLLFIIQKSISIL